jgi:hypothetical protein
LITFSLCQTIGADDPGYLYLVTVQPGFPAGYRMRFSALMRGMAGNGGCWHPAATRPGGLGALRNVSNLPGKRGLVGRVQDGTVREKSALREKMYGR